jgi:hypothetical protein
MRQIPFQGGRILRYFKDIAVKGLPTLLREYILYEYVALLLCRFIFKNQIFMLLQSKSIAL